MKGFGKLHIKSGQSGQFNDPMSSVHLTTFNFGQIQPVLAYETIGKDRQRFQIEGFTRLSPLAKPTYGDFSLHTLSVFVPYYQLADDYEAWRIGRTTFEGYVPGGRFIRMLDYVNFLIANVFTSVSVPSGSSADGKGHFVNGSGTVTGIYDWVVIGSSGNPSYFKKKDSFGKYIFKVLVSLGYGLPSNVDLQSGSAWLQYYSLSKNYLSAFPLLAFFKAYNDWMSQSQRFNTSVLSAFLRAIKHNMSAVTGYNNVNRTIDPAGLLILFNNISLTYENDYFTSAWQKPNSPLASVETINSFKVPSESHTDEVDVYPDDTRLELDSVSDLDFRSVDLLNRVALYVRRRNYSGSKAVQQVFSELGIKPEDYKSNYSHVIDTRQHAVTVGDVMSTADTASAILGDYAGKGIQGSKDDFKFHASDYGCLLYLAWYTVKPLYPYGFDRSVFRNDPREFYNAEFDGMSADAISLAEVATSPLRLDTTKDYDVFGFTEKYNTYRFIRDKVSGDFLDFHSDGEMNTWHLARILDDVRNQGQLVAQSSSFNTMSPSTNEFNRIFSYTKDDFDHFLSIFRIKVTGSRPIKNLSQVTNLGEGNITVSRGGNEVS